MKKIEKSPFDPFVKWFFPKLLPFVPQWMTANVISFSGILVCFLAAVALGLSFLSPVFYIVGAALFLLTWVTDTMDGIVARARNQQSVVGHYLDHYGDSWNIVFIGVGLFVSNGSHLAVGLACAVVYLMFHVDGHIKVQITDTLELPAFGPTEVRFLITGVLVAAAFIDPGQPLSWFPEMTGADGWLATALGMTGGMTFLDVAGTFVAACGFIGLVAETVLMVRRFSREDRARVTGAKPKSKAKTAAKTKGRATTGTRSTRGKA